MFYEEKIINGILMSRSHPNDPFEPVSVEKLNNTVCMLKSEVDTLREENEKLRSKVQTVVKRDDIMNRIRSIMESEMCDMAQEYGLKHGDVSPEWTLQFDAETMILANLMCTWITDNKPNTIVAF